MYYFKMNKLFTVLIYLKLYEENTHFGTGLISNIVLSEISVRLSYVKTHIY